VEAAAGFSKSRRPAGEDGPSISSALAETHLARERFLVLALRVVLARVVLARFVAVFLRPAISWLLVRAALRSDVRKMNPRR